MSLCIQPQNPCFSLMVFTLSLERRASKEQDQDVITPLPSPHGFDKHVKIEINDFNSDCTRKPWVDLKWAVSSFILVFCQHTSTPYPPLYKEYELNGLTPIYPYCDKWRINKFLTSSLLYVPLSQPILWLWLWKESAQKKKKKDKMQHYVILLLSKHY